MREVFIMDPARTAGGLCLLWKEEIWVSVKVLLSIHYPCKGRTSHAAMQYNDLMYLWSAIFALETTFLEELKMIARLVGSPWAVVGDLNEILSSKEKRKANWDQHQAGNF